MRYSLDAQTKAAIALLLILGVIALAMMIPFERFAAQSEKYQSDAVEQAIQWALIECYALEGSYPPDLYYLRDRYGLILDESRYYFRYEIFASNVRPEVMVTAKFQRQER